MLQDEEAAEKIRFCAKTKNNKEKMSGNVWQQSKEILITTAKEKYETKLMKKKETNTWQNQEFKEQNKIEKRLWNKLLAHKTYK